MRTFRQKTIAAGTAVALSAAAFAAPREGFEPVAKHERIDPPGVITEGYGRTNYDDPGLKIGDTITEIEARRLLADDLARKYLPPIRVCIRGFDKMPLSRQVAFLDGAYNLGSRTICKSSMVRKLNAGDLRGACDAFMLYDRANGKVIRGLQKRRADERALCLKEG